MTLIVLIVVYLLSTLRMYFWFKNAFSKGGTFQYSHADLPALLFTITPALNTVASFVCTTNSINGKEDGGVVLDKFFRVKK